MVGCVQPRLHEDPGLLRAIAHRLRSTDRRRHVPHALVGLGPDNGPSHAADPDLVPITTDDVAAVRDVLSRVADELARDPGAYRFPRFWLIVWLMSQTFDDGVTTQQRLGELRRRLRRRAVQPMAEQGEAVAGELPVWLRVGGSSSRPSTSGPGRAAAYPDSAVGTAGSSASRTWRPHWTAASSDWPSASPRGSGRPRTPSRSCG